MILGINGHPEFSHDAGVAAIVDGRVVAVFEEERFSRRKKGRKTLPFQAGRALRAMLPREDVEAVAFAWNPRNWSEMTSEYDALIAEFLEATGLGGGSTPPIRYMDHHVSHAFAGQVFLPRPARAEPTIYLVLDGRGEVCSGAAYRSDGSRIEPLWHLPLSASLGLAYEAVTQVIGFGWGHEGKTMGLAAYGTPGSRAVPGLDTIDAGLTIATAEVVPATSRLEVKNAYNALRASRKNAMVGLVAEPADTFMGRAHLAASAQQWLERTVLDLVTSLVEAHPETRNVVLAGGVALNCSVNSAVEDQLLRSGRCLVVPPCASDSGVALGAAVALASSVGVDVDSVEDAYLGVETETAALARFGYRTRPTDATEIAELLRDGAVLGRVTGRAEVGPRALGNRAIIGSAGSTGLRDEINRLKSRESWRPLAPVVDQETATTLLDGPSDEYMLRTARVVDHPELAGVRHADGTARPKVVRETEKDLAALMEAVRQTVGVGALLCTSFNGAGEPIINDLTDAVVTGRRLGLTGLCGADWILEF